MGKRFVLSAAEENIGRGTCGSLKFGAQINSNDHLSRDMEAELVQLAILRVPFASRFLL